LVLLDLRLPSCFKPQKLDSEGLLGSEFLTSFSLFLHLFSEGERSVSFPFQEALLALASSSK